MNISIRGREVVVDGKALPMEYAVREAFVLSGSVIVLLDPDAYMQDPAYPKERRRGVNPLRNLRAYAPSGELLWEAEFPEPADYYYKVVERHPLTVLSFSSFRCRIDPATGRIAGQEPLK